MVVKLNGNCERVNKMCTSDPAVKNGLIEYVKYCGLPKSIFDIGMGNGGYGKRFKDIDPTIHMTGLEIFASYIRDDWGYSKLYDKVYIGDMRTFDYSKVNAELVIAGDVIEHVVKDEGIKVIEQLVRHYEWVLVAVPIVYFPQGADNEYGNIHEEHKHHWGIKEMVKATGLKSIGVIGVCGLFEFIKT